MTGNVISSFSAFDMEKNLGLLMLCGGLGWQIGEITCERCAGTFEKVTNRAILAVYALVTKTL